MSLFKSKSITHEVGGQQIEFFSLSFPILFQLKSAVGPIAKVLGNLFRPNRHDVGRFEQTEKDPKTGAPVRVVQEQPISLDLAKFRADQSVKNTQEAIEALFADQNRVLVGRILMDSMRSSQPRKPTPDQINEFLDSIDLSIFIEMIQGVVKANAEVFGPLGSGWAKQATDLLRAQGSSASPTSSAPASESASSEPPVPPGPRLVPKE